MKKLLVAENKHISTSCVKENPNYFLMMASEYSLSISLHELNLHTTC